MSKELELETQHEVSRLSIDTLETAIRGLPDHFVAADGDNEFVQTQHFFGPGVYVRQLTRKAGVVIVGKVHREPCISILLKGCMAVTSSDGIPTVVQAGAVWLSGPGAKRATYALEDSILITVHQNPTNTTDLAELEAAIIQEES